MSERRLHWQVMAEGPRPARRPGFWRRREDEMEIGSWWAPWFRLIAGLLILCSGGVLAQSAPQVGDGATQIALIWEGPRSGPPAQADKTLVYIAEDLKNAGILGVGEGIREAAAVIGWRVRFLDIGGADAQRDAVFSQALGLQPDGVIFGGGDAVANRRNLQLFQQRGIPVLGWHAAPFPGPIAGTPVRLNVTTDSLSVARRAAQFVIESSQGAAGVVIFTDSRYAIALKKSDTMAEAVRHCASCALLSIEDVSLSTAFTEMPRVTQALLQRYGERWTHSLAINDLYFDHAVTTLVRMGHFPDGAPINVSAGDGSPSAFMRIRHHSYQQATVPEPLYMQGWQLVDELNRLFAAEPLSGYVNPAYLVTGDTLRSSRKADIFDPDNGYRDYYRRIWTGDAH